jgi:hypothetical protein
VVAFPGKEEANVSLRKTVYPQLAEPISADELVLDFTPTERVFEKVSRRSEPVEHEADGCDIDQGLRRLDHIFVVFAEQRLFSSGCIRLHPNAKCNWCPPRRLVRPSTP